MRMRDEGRHTDTLSRTAPAVFECTNSYRTCKLYYRIRDSFYTYSLASSTSPTSTSSGVVICKLTVTLATAPLHQCPNLNLGQDTRANRSLEGNAKSDGDWVPGRTRPNFSMEQEMQMLG